MSGVQVKLEKGVHVKLEKGAKRADPADGGKRLVHVYKPKTPWEVRVKTEPQHPHAGKRAAVKQETPEASLKLEDSGEVVSVELVRKPNEKPWDVIVIEDDNDEDEDKRKTSTLAAQVEESLRKGVASVQRARRVESERKSLALARTAGGLAEERSRPAWEEERDDPQRLIPPPASWELDGAQARLGNNRRWGEGGKAEERLVCLKNYAAIGVDCDDDCLTTEQDRTPSRGVGGCYGLIDRGTREGGVRMLIMHVKEGGRDQLRHPGRPLLERIRPGSSLVVQSTLAGGIGGTLRVRYTTPARYYSPGERVTTLAIGVDAVSWQSLVPKRRRI
jgi:hypothetical protein